MKKPNILHICGDNSYLCEYDKNELVRVFREKYGVHSTEIHTLENPEKYNELQMQIQSVGLFNDKRMFVFTGGKAKKPGRKKKDEIIPTFADNLEEILPHISDDDFLVFYNISQIETELIKWLAKNATERKYTLSFSPAGWKKFFDISEKNLKKILAIYEKAEKLREKYDSNPLLGHAIASTIKNIETLEKNNSEITDEIIWEFSHEYAGEKIFDFIDAIMARNVEKALKMNETLAQTTESAEAFYGSLIGILRKNLYIIFLRDHWLTKSNIVQILPEINAYMVDKAMKSSLTHREFSKFYQKIIEASIAYKSGKWMKQTILWRFFEIDTALFMLKK